MTENVEKDMLISLYRAAVMAADPAEAMARHLPARSQGRTIVVAIGKGAAEMARAFAANWNGPVEGLVVTRYGHGRPVPGLEVIEAGHPVPDAAGAAAARRLLALVSGLTADDLVVALVSGGGSALLPAPLPGLTLEDEIVLNKALLASGAPIAAMNALRKQVSAIKGGRLALAAAPAKVTTLIVSDVPGDDPALVASGPTVPDAVSREEARELAALYRLELTPAVARLLASDDHPAPRPDHPALAQNEVHVIASAAKSLEAAVAVAREAGFEAAILSDAIEGEAREAGTVLAALTREVALRDRPFRKPVVLLSGGETTVTLKSGAGGRGGRNSEFLLSFAFGTDGLKRVTALAADTDGIDGTEDNAGAFANGTSIQRLRAAGIDPRALLAAHESYDAFAAVGDLFAPGPTGTNVNDFRAILIA